MSYTEKIVHLPKEIWKGTVLPIGYIADECYEVEKRQAPERCLPIRKHRGAREKRYSFGYAVFLILALMK